MSKVLPTSGFKWKMNIAAIVPNGCVLEVDLENPKELQELRNDYSLTPDEIEIKKEMLSNSKKFFARFDNSSYYIGP